MFVSDRSSWSPRCCPHPVVPARALWVLGIGIGFFLIFGFAAWLAVPARVCDIDPQYIGTATGLMLTLAAVGGFFIPIISGTSCPIRVSIPAGFSRRRVLRICPSRPDRAQPGHRLGARRRGRAGPAGHLELRVPMAPGLPCAPAVPLSAPITPVNEHRPRTPQSDLYGCGRYTPLCAGCRNHTTTAYTTTAPCGAMANRSMWADFWASRCSRYSCWWRHWVRRRPSTPVAWMCPAGPRNRRRSEGARESGKHRVTADHPS